MQFHTKKRNRLEYKRLNKLVDVSYNKKCQTGFKKSESLAAKDRRATLSC
jgi:hypothetical protein